MDADWTATALFSPSKAAAQRAQAKDWAAVDSWLVKRYGARVPAFERNEETLQALLTLANFNESADEQRGQVERIEKAASQALAKRLNGPMEEVIDAMMLELASETHLDTLAEAMVESDCPDGEITTMTGNIVELMTAAFETSERVKRTEAQLKALGQEQEQLRKLINELKGNSFIANGDLVEATAEWQKTTKQLKAKVAEYEERLGTSRPGAGESSMAHLQLTMQELNRQRNRLAMLQAELQTYQNLPTDPAAAKRKVEEAKDELRSLTARRDEMFLNLAQD